jgi:hypothetical protein
VNRLHLLLASFAALFVLNADRVEAHDPSETATGAADTTEVAKEPTAGEIARQDQNPITRFYVMRFEDNVQVGVGPHDEAQNFFRFQPLVPLRLGEDWTLLTRFIVPLVHQPWPQTNDGLGDISVIAFVTPARSGKFVWGVGPALLLPTATRPELGTERFSAGPAVAGVYTSGAWVVGVVAQNLWSFAGDNDRLDVQVMTLRPLVNYNLPQGWYLTTSPSIAANWETDEDEDRWLVPVGGGVGKVFKIGRQRMSTTVESYYHVESPKFGPNWQMRLQLSFLYPD